MLRAHRAAAAVWLGFDPASRLKVCHRCDNPPCFNPKHLFFGTDADNSADMVAKGRSTRGDKNPRRKISERQARAILKRLAAGEVKAHLAEEYGVSPSTIGMLAAGTMWSHLPRSPQITLGPLRGERSPNARLTETDAKDILRRLEGGERQSDIAADYGLTKQYVGQIAAGKKWTHLRRGATPLGKAGSRNAAAVLTEENVAEIRARRAAGETQATVAAAFGVSRSTVAAIDQGRIWPETTDAPLPGRQPMTQVTRA